jgi:hypothetical protein
VTTANPQRAWCNMCRATRLVVDTFETDEGDAYAENARGHQRRARIARPLDCGHDADEGREPYDPPAVTDDRALVARVVALQEARR